MHRGLSVLRIALVAVLGFCIWNAGTAKAADIEALMVPSAAMGRDIPVAFLAGGPHAAYLLDGFNAGPDVSNWVTAGNGFNTLAGKGISVIAPAGGAYSMYTNWEQDGSKQWETFLSSELPDWLAANKGLAPGGHGVVGVSQGGYAAAALVTFHPDRFRYAGSLSGFLTPERAGVDGTITAALKQGGADTDHMWGAAPAGSLEMALAQPQHPAAGRQQCPAVGLQPGQRSPDRPRRDGRLRRYLPRHQRDVLLALSRRRRHQRSLRLGPRRRQRLADVEPTARRNVRRSGCEHPLATIRKTRDPTTNSGPIT